MSKSKRKPVRDKRPPPAVTPPLQSDALVIMLLLIAMLVVFGGVWDYEFVSYHDPEHVTANPVVSNGLTLDGAAWAFTTYRIGRWFPLTWLSHMVDAQLFGQRSGLHHLMNLLLHACSVLLLFVLLKRMTGHRWRSAVVALLFAVHPLHVEPVAWVAQRKEVLSTLFFFLTIRVYLRYVERPGTRWYLLVITIFCLGLLAGPMVIALPVVLVLIDVWPLRRLRSTAPEGGSGTTKGKETGRELKSLGGIFLEKAALFELAAGAAVAIAAFQQPSASLRPQESVPIWTRLAHVLVSWSTYLVQTIRPARLAVSYPHASMPPFWQVIGAGLVLVGISFLALRFIRRIPYLATGWFWYLATLLPAVGLVLTGAEPQVDRYTYLPLVGIFVLLSWGLADIFSRLPGWKTALGYVTAAACLVCVFLSWDQVKNWKNGESLFRHAIEATGGDYVAYYGLAGTLRDQGRLEEAVLPYIDAIQSVPGDARAYGELADIFVKQGKVDEAVTLYREAVRLNPDSRQDRLNLGIALTRAGKAADSIEQLTEAVRMDPESADAHYSLGQAYAAEGRFSEALVQFAETAQLQPDNAEAHYNLGTTFAREGKMNEAVDEFETALRIRPGYASAHNNLGSALASLGRIDEAVAHFSEAVRLAPDSEEARRNLEYGLSLQGKSIKR
jgi:tetratricopeptide (TPR) repeat protein